jgi:tetratricopeptide (TPR) repeat protein
LGADEILKLSGQYLNKYQEPSMHLYRAYAYMLLDDVASAYGAAIESCRLDSRYSSGMMYLGTQYYIKKQYQSAEKFYQGAISIDPGIRIGLFQYGNCLQKLGKIRESLRVYELDVTRNGPFPTEFMMVEAYMRLGERAAAIRTFKEALRHLDEFSSPVVTSNTYAEALYKILEFMEQNGLKEAVATFRRRPMMQRMFNDFPQH